MRVVLPVLVELPRFGVAIHSRGVMIVLAALLCHLVGPPWIERVTGVDRRRTRRALLWLLLPAVLGARLHWVANHWSSVADRPLAALMPWQQGMHAGGAIIAMAFAMPLVLRRMSIPVAAFADAAVAPIAAAIGVARLGCFLRGCCYGRVCEWPWGVRFPPDSLPYAERAVATGQPLHPVQVYFVLAAFAVAALALWMQPRKRYGGQIALVGLLSYAASAALIEVFRADHPGRVYWGPLPQLEWTALAMVAAAASALALRSHRRAPL